MYPYRKELLSYARELRRNMTEEEKHLWYACLRYLPVRVKRQKSIENYIVDFYIPKARLVIEIDGLQHGTDEHKAADDARDAALARLGLTVLRFSNKRIHQDFKGVCNDILHHLGLDSLSFAPPS